MRPLILALLATLPCACAGHDETAPRDEAPAAQAPAESTPASTPAAEAPVAEAPAEPAAADAQDPVAALRADIAELQARAEKDVDEIEVQHILISFRGAPRMDPTKVTRTQEEAEALAAQIYAELEQGGDFQALMAKHTDDDPVSGRYRMTRVGQGNPPKVYPRSGMVPAFGDVGWRLEVGAIGVAPLDPQKSPFGWHIVKRLE